MTNVSANGGITLSGVGISSARETIQRAFSRIHTPEDAVQEVDVATMSATEVESAVAELVVGEEIVDVEVCGLGVEEDVLDLAVLLKTAAEQAEYYGEFVDRACEITVPTETSAQLIQLALEY